MYSYNEDHDLQFYKTSRYLAKKMDVLDWNPRSYEEEIVQGGENLLDMARQLIIDETAQRAPPIIPKPLIGVHHGNPSRGANGEEVEGMEEEEEEEYDTRVEGEEEASVTTFTQHSETPPMEEGYTCWNSTK